MAMVINTNMASITAQRHLTDSRAQMETAMERLSSGKRINGAQDDAAGLSIAHNMDQQIASLTQANRNANDGVAMINLAEGAMDQFSSMLTRMKELATQASNGIYSDADRTNMNNEFTALATEITRIANVTVYNGINVLNKDNNAVKFHVGEKDDDTITATFKNMKATDIGGGSDTVAKSAAITVTQEFDGSTAQEYKFALAAATDIISGRQLVITVDGKEYRQSFVDSDKTGGKSAANDTATLNALGVQIEADLNVTAGEGAAGALNIEANDTSTSFTVGNLTVVSPGGNIAAQTITSVAKANTAMDNVDAAITEVDTYRAELGATANQLEQTAANLLTRVQYTSAARSQIMDADYAVESANLAKAQVLQQAGTAMLAQANASAQNVLSLLK